MIPRTSLSGVRTGTHITDRIFRSAIEQDREASSVSRAPEDSSLPPSVTAIASETTGGFLGGALGTLGKKTNSTTQILILSLAARIGGGSLGSSFRPLRKVKFREWR